MGTGTMQGELWGAKARDWAELAEPQTRPLWDSLFDALQVGPGLSLADLGCGAGGAARVAAARGAGISGVDASENLLSLARQRVPSGDFQSGDLEQLPFESGVFDVAVAINSLQFVGDKAKALAEIRRVLKPGGQLGTGMWCEPDRCEMAAVFGALMEIAPPPPSTEPTLTVRDNLAALLEANAFRITSEGEVECPFLFANLEEAWRGLRSAGMVEAATRAVGEDKVREALETPIRSFQHHDGSVRCVNWFRWMVCA